MPKEWLESERLEAILAVSSNAEMKAESKAKRERFPNPSKMLLDAINVIKMLSCQSADFLNDNNNSERLTEFGVSVE